MITTSKSFENNKQGQVRNHLKSFFHTIFQVVNIINLTKCYFESNRDITEYVCFLFCGTIIVKKKKKIIIRFSVSFYLTSVLYKLYSDLDNENIKIIT